MAENVVFEQHAQQLVSGAGVAEKGLGHFVVWVNRIIQDL